MTVPLVRLPSLDLVRGFVAVGRRMSVTLGAQDLCITQSAMSKQIKALEEQVGVRLLERSHRAIMFTTQGRVFFDAANAALQQLQDAYGEALPGKDERAVVITAPTGVSGLWLSARLGRFQQAHPNVGVRLASNNAIVDLKAEGIDLAIRYCHPDEAPTDAIWLFGDTMAPVLSKSLGVSDLNNPQAFESLILLEFDDNKRPWLQWSSWFDASGWKGVKPKGIVRFNQYDQVIQAAVEGQGVALGRLEILSHMLVDGRLYSPALPRAPSQSAYSYWLVKAAGEVRRPTEVFVKWLQQEAAAMNQVMIATLRQKT